MNKDSKYFLWASTHAQVYHNSPNTPEVEEVEFFVAGFDVLKEARRQGRKLLGFPGFEAVWVIRRADGEVVQPHEKF